MNCHLMKTWLSHFVRAFESQGSRTPPPVHISLTPVCWTSWAFMPCSEELTAQPSHSAVTGGGSYLPGSPSELQWKLRLTSRAVSRCFSLLLSLVFKVLTTYDCSQRPCCLFLKIHLFIMNSFIDKHRVCSLSRPLISWHVSLSTAFSLCI